MILLRPDFLAFESADGELIPCSAQEVVVELMGDAAQWLDEEVIRHASEAVLHFFRHEKGRETVSMAEFVQALEQVLKGLGFEIKAGGTPKKFGLTAPSGAGESPGLSPSRRVIEADLLELAGQSQAGAELFFFPLLRDAVNRRLDGSPLVLRFRGLRECVKRIVGAKRWNPACQSMNDQIVDYLRTCLSQGKAGEGCALVVV